MLVLNRRKALAVFGAGAATLATGWPKMLSADDDYFEKQLRTIGSSADAVTIRQALAQALVDPTWATLASTTLQNNITNLTGFQQDLLQSVSILTRDPASVSALIAGKTLTSAQIASLESINSAVRQNPAFKKLYQVADDLGDNTSLLSTYVQGLIASNSQTVPTPTGLGMPLLDAVIGDFVPVRQSTAFSNVATALNAVFSAPGFVGYLGDQPPRVVAQFIPIDTILAMTLPSDKDPALSPITLGTIEIIGGYAAIMAGLVAILIGGGALAVIAGILGIIAGLAALIVGFNDLYKDIDCDFDGDPSDPNDVPGNECPAV